MRPQAGLEHLLTLFMEFPIDTLDSRLMVVTHQDGTDTTPLVTDNDLRVGGTITELTSLHQFTSPAALATQRNQRSVPSTQHFLPQNR